METQINIICRDEDEGHWDIWNEKKRLCKIRGKANDFYVYNDYGNIKEKGGFRTVNKAIKYICKSLMREPKAF